MEGALGFVRWYVLARLSAVALELGRSADGSPPPDAAVCEAWYALSDLAYVALRDG